MSLLAELLIFWTGFTENKLLLDRITEFTNKGIYAIGKI